MTHFVGLDISQKMAAICIVAKAGRDTMARSAPVGSRDPFMVRRHSEDDVRIGVVHELGDARFRKDRSRPPAVRGKSAGIWRRTG